MARALTSSSLGVAVLSVCTEGAVHVMGKKGQLLKDEDEGRG